MKDFVIKTPRGKLIKTKNGTIELKFNEKYIQKKEKNYSRAQKVVDSEVLRLSEPYVPFKKGFLRQSGTLGTIIGSGEVAYLAPYSRYIYFGFVMIGKPPKRKTNKLLTYHGGGNVGRLWFEVMKRRYKKEILEKASNEL